ncbi:MAG TPA: CHASE3 domain-containing protein, partial [Verrucomicrobiae bacterium]|nr:CHASE3 domain-containing protein [Verrucomicrobiae bacterium]
MARLARASGEALKLDLIALAAIVATIVVVGIVAAKINADNQRAMLGIFETREILTQTFVNVIDQEVALRGYADSGDRRFLAPYAPARAAIGPNLAALSAAGGPALA